jgi:DNA-binding CsgD family transcriptional regulator
MGFLEQLMCRCGLGIPVADTPTYKISPELLAALEQLAVQEQRPLATLIEDILHAGIAQHHTATENLYLWQLLTPREQQTAALTCLGCTNQEIADAMVISPNTVRTHVRNVLYKLNLNSKVELQHMLAGWDFSPWLTDQDDLNTT